MSRSEERRVGEEGRSWWLREPSEEEVVILTAAKLLAGLSCASLKPKSAAARVRGVSSLMVMVLLAPSGASFTLVTLKVMVLAAWARTTARFVTVVQTCARKVKEA